MVAIYRIPVVFAFFIITVFSGCTPVQPSVPYASLQGYRTTCNGALWLVESGATATELKVAGGQQVIEVRHVSEPYTSESFPRDDYVCQTITLHQVIFQANEGKIYKLKAEDNGVRDFHISVYEILEPGLPDAVSVANSSYQLHESQSCRFLNRGDVCLSDSAN